jgi:hypothetical protein
MGKKAHRTKRKRGCATRHLTTACTRPAARWMSYTIKGLGGRVMPGVGRLTWSSKPETF